MIVCTIMGHELPLDFSMWDKEDSAISRVVSLPGDEVEFLLCGDVDTNLFSWACTCLGACKKDFPRTHITVTMVAPKCRQKALERDLVRREHRVDRVVAPDLPSSPGRPDRIAHQNRVVRWCIENSTHVISYVYLPLATRWNRLYLYAKERGVNIIDIIDPQIQDLILENIARLPPRKQQIFQSMQDGKTLSEVAAQHNISAGHLNWIIHREGQKLVDAIHRRLSVGHSSGSIFDPYIVL